MSYTKISDEIIYVGVDDNDIDLFESQYKVPEGISYNSYIIKDEKTVLMDTVDARKSKQWLENVKEVLQGEKIDYLVISHLEPDHSANIQKITELYPNVTLIGNSKTFEMLPQFFNINTEINKLVVKEGESINIGKHTLQFFMAPMVHWPEVMVTYEQSEKIVFSADGFGRFGDLKSSNNGKLYSENSKDWTEEARRYYINIVGKYGMQVQMLLKKLATLDVKMICPLHGPVLKDDLNFYINKYDIWSSYKYEEEGILVAYASIHGNTANVAHKVVETLKKLGTKNIKLMDLARDDIHEVVSDAFKYNKMIVLASSYNMGIFPPMETFLNTLKAKNYQNRKVGIIENGSWAPSAGRCMIASFEEMKNIAVIEPIITIKTSMKENNIKDIETLCNNITK